MNRDRTPTRLRGRRGRLKVILVGPVWKPAPADGYAGIERVVAAIAEELHRRGADVTMAAGPGSHIPGVDTITLPLTDPPYDHIGKRLNVVADLPAAQELMALKAACDGGFDIASVHNWPFSALTWNGLDDRHYPPTRVQTFHGPLERTDLPICELALQMFAEGDIFCNGISESQMSTAAAKLVVSRTIEPWNKIYNPLHLKYIRLTPPPHNDEVRFINFARITWVKGQAKIAKLCYQHGWTLDLYGSVAEDIHSLEQFLAINANSSDPHQDHEDFIYFRDQVLPYLGETVNWRGPVVDIAAACDGALAYLNAIGWDEPFGLAPIEAAACGLPVITINRGALSETVRPGENGILCADMVEFEKAVASIAEREMVFNRRRVRRLTLARFHPRVIADQYVAFFEAAMEIGSPA